MERREKMIDGRRVLLYGREAPQYLLVQMADGYDDRQALDREADIIAQGTNLPFVLAAVPVRDWMADLSPWPAPAAFGREPFSGRARDTLNRLETVWLPDLRRALGLSPETETVLGGYSLAGLFALWAAYESSGFSGVAAASPSVWFPGFPEYARARRPQAKKIYLSLGDREEKTRNPAMSAVGDQIRALHAALQQIPGLQCALEWNSGNHFQDADKRTARAFLWVLTQK